MATLSDAHARMLSPITELTTPNSSHTLALLAVNADTKRDGDGKKSIVYKARKIPYGNLVPPKSFAQLDGSVQSSAVSVSSYLAESRSQIPRPASPSSNQRSFIPI